MIVGIYYRPENKDLVLEFNYHGFFSENNNGNTFKHRKVFKEKKTLRSTEDFLKHLEEIEVFYEKILT